MREISVDETKLIMVRILESIDKCCRENNIKYSLCWGTMIGAVRHHGFIPWDDDIDIMMPREDYNRFLKVYNDSRYGVYSPRNNKNCVQIITKIYDKRTSVYFHNHPKSIFGIWISIFPYDNVPDENLNKWKLKRTFWMSLYHFKTARFLTTDSFLMRTTKALTKAIVFPFSSFWLYEKLEKCLTEFNDIQTKRVCIWTGVGRTKTTFIIFNKEWFDECMDIDFENQKTRIIKGYDQFLRFRYGDYMKFPPEQERIPKHNFKAYYID